MKEWARCDCSAPKILNMTASMCAISIGIPRTISLQPTCKGSQCYEFTSVYMSSVLNINNKETLLKRILQIRLLCKERYRGYQK